MLCCMGMVLKSNDDAICEHAYILLKCIHLFVKATQFYLLQSLSFVIENVLSAVP